ncbi:MAG TPA: adenylate/guanylate cyclase domain-containing protein [Longimicrobium sp.]|uniref:adenylate/guanylate cyclase domain-containing protein n=1 Tax=Longimicrobium sp. TaxID=2029185 RepID=UPI002EDA0E6E
MRRLAALLALPRTSFRARLLLALVGSVGLLLAAALLVVRVQTRRQVAVMVDRAVQRTDAAYREMEEARLRQLRGYTARFAGSNRLPAALEEAVLSPGAAEFLGETALYELQLAGIPDALAAFGARDGSPVAAVLDGAPLPDAGAALPASAASAVAGPAEGVASHHRVGGRLYTVQTVPLALFGEPVGTLTLGIPLDDAAAAQLGRSVGAEVCFLADGRCVASTPGVRRGGLDRRMRDAARAGARRRTRWNGARMALVPARLASGGGAQEVTRIVAIPLEDVLRPFDQLERAQAAAGLVSLLVALALGTVLSRSFARPVRALVSATRKVAEGDLETRVAVAGRDELGTLAAAFNEMTHGLMLKERYRGVLDKVVSREVADELLKGEIRLGGETRDVTSLFADVRGFTSLAEGMDPERVIGLLNELVGRMGAAVEAEGGVVDKFLGDGLMAIFGAPGVQPGHALHAVRAAVRMRDAVAGVNAERAVRGEANVEVGIGINSGPAVAGNMGSPGRLNYTVLGESVNLASRLCSSAAGAEILVARATWERVEDEVDAVPGGVRSIKGLSAPVEVFRVRGLRAAGRIPVPGLAVLALALLACAPAAAQPLPALADLGATWTSPGGTVQVTPRGRLELEANLPGEARAWQVPGAEPVFQPRAALFLDAFAGSRWYAGFAAHAERARPLGEEDVSVRIEQAFLRWSPLGGDGLFVQAGQFVSPFGSYPARHHTPADPFIRPPLPYDHRTILSAARVPGGAAGFLRWKDDPAVHRPEGAPPVWAAPYPTGAMVGARAGRLDGRVAVLTSAPSAEPRRWRFRAKDAAPSLAASAGVRLTPGARIGASFSRGPYLEPSPLQPAADTIDADEFHQQLWAVDASFTRGWVEARAEVIVDRWEVPNVSEDPRDLSWTAEAKVKLSPALFVAGRYGAMRFNRIGAVGEQVRWDYDVDRAELGAGLRLGRHTEVRAEYLRLRTGAPPAGDDDAFALRWAWVF